MAAGQHLRQVNAMEQRGAGSSSTAVQRDAHLPSREVGILSGKRVWASRDDPKLRKACAKLADFHLFQSPHVQRPVRAGRASTGLMQYSRSIQRSLGAALVYSW